MSNPSLPIHNGSGFVMPPYGQSLYRDPRLQQRSLLPALDVHPKPKSHVSESNPSLGALGFNLPYTPGAPLSAAHSLATAFEGLKMSSAVSKRVPQSGEWLCGSSRPNNTEASATNISSSTSNPSTPPRSASSSSTNFSFTSSPSSATSFTSGLSNPTTNVLSTMICNFARPALSDLPVVPVPAPPRFQIASQVSAAGHPEGLMGPGVETVYATPNVSALLNNTDVSTPALNAVPGLAPRVPSPAIPPTGLTPPPQANGSSANGSTINFHTILAPSGVRLAQGGRVRNVSPDESNPILMFWPDNEPLPSASQCRPPLPPGYRAPANSKTPHGGPSLGLPPILNTGNVGPMAKQPLDWMCGVCGYTNWRRRKVCQCCFPYAPGNEPPANHADRIKVITALLLAAHQQQQRERESSDSVGGLPSLPLNHPLSSSNAMNAVHQGPMVDTLPAIPQPQIAPMPIRTISLDAGIPQLTSVNSLNTYRSGTPAVVGSVARPAIPTRVASSSALSGGAPLPLFGSELLPANAKSIWAMDGEARQPGSGGAIARPPSTSTTTTASSTPSAASASNTYPWPGVIGATTSRNIVDLASTPSLLTPTGSSATTFNAIPVVPPSVFSRRDSLVPSMTSALGTANTGTFANSTGTAPSRGLGASQATSYGLLPGTSTGASAYTGSNWTCGSAFGNAKGSSGLSGGVGLGRVIGTGSAHASGMF
ncbi:hypothetical protein FRB99_008286 [Tulasnella sp. 403]|nr:hypothetical protein FRB99_008286 [Tulasnella sp. 403]